VSHGDHQQNHHHDQPDGAPHHLGVGIPQGRRRQAVHQIQAGQNRRGKAAASHPIASHQLPARGVGQLEREPGSRNDLQHRGNQGHPCSPHRQTLGIGALRFVVLRLTQCVDHDRHARDGKRRQPGVKEAGRNFGIQQHSAVAGRIGGQLRAFAQHGGNRE